jgi:hypothetical protein
VEQKVHGKKRLWLSLACFTGNYVIKLEENHEEAVWQDSRSQDLGPEI